MRGHLACDEGLGVGGWGLGFGIDAGRFEDVGFSVRVKSVAAICLWWQLLHSLLFGFDFSILNRAYLAIRDASG